MSDITTRCIMLIDDHAMVRHGLASLINATTDLRVVVEAENKHDALRIIESDIKIDIILLDLSLTDVPDISFIEHLSKRDRDIPILVVSMHSEQVYAERALKAGAYGYVMKQEQGGTLIAAIRHVLDGKIYLSPSMMDAILRGGKSVSNNPASLVERLTEIELDILRLLARGLTSSEMAKLKNRSIKTIESHRANIRVKLCLKNSADVIRFAARLYPT